MHTEPWTVGASDVSQHMIPNSFLSNPRDDSMMDTIPATARGTDLVDHVAEKQICSGDAQKTPHRTTNHEKRGLESLVTCLSELSTRACFLYGAVLDLANSMESLEQSGIELHRNEPFADDSAFQTLTGWLVSASSDVPPPVRPQRASGTSSTADEGCDLLHNIFAVSHDLLSALKLPNDQFSKPSTNAHLELLRSHPSDTTTPASVSPSAGSMRSTPSSGDVLSGPGHRSSSTHPVDSRTPSGNGAGLQADALGEVQVVVVVQLCTFLTERQAQAVHNYLAQQLEPEL
ncbi:hypothetical protein E4T47_06944 [Aureobasidium subglaciale]|nr:hypothetical protein E4T47_06944 [Aureobasidium subglaciale]